MNTTRSYETVLADVIGIVAQALMTKPDKVHPESRLYRDLGAESIDVLDVRFRLERHFSLTIPEGAIIRSLGPDLTPAQVDEALTPASIARFVRSMLETSEQ
jgi:acyl carrier protein